MLVEFQQNFTPNSVDLTVVVGDEKTVIHAKIGQTQPLIALGTLYAQSARLERTPPEKIYVGLLEGLKSFLEAGSRFYQPNPEAANWFHGAILAFVRRYVDCYSASGFDLFSALTCLAELFEARKLPSWLTLVATGHVVGTLTARTKTHSRERWLELKRVRCLWRVPQHILRTNIETVGAGGGSSSSNTSTTSRARVRGAGRQAAANESQEFQSLNCLATRTALFFMSTEDSSSNVFFPSYAPFSGAVPLANCLALQAKTPYSVQ